MAELGPLDPHSHLKVANRFATERYLSRPGIIGTGIGEKNGRAAIVIMVEKKLPLAALKFEDVIAQKIDDVPTDVLEVGHITALAKARTDKWRPAPGGVSIGHYQITAGTLGVVVKAKESQAPLILSNNHVLANSNKAEHGDPILQPGPIDGGSDDDRIGLLFDFQPIDFGEEEPDSCPLAETYIKVGNWLSKLFKSKQIVFTKKINAQAINYVDAALAIPNEPSDITDDILEIGRVAGIIEPFIGMRVSKSGRTTGLLSSMIKLLHATLTVDYGEGRKAVFQDQIITGYMSAGGDSGSLGVEGSNKAFGLLFAGSSQTTIFNPIDKVIDALGIEI